MNLSELALMILKANPVYIIVGAIGGAMIMLQVFDGWFAALIGIVVGILTGAYTSKEIRK
ncbi:MAG: hypothetical protein ETSY2_31625 [Candidatus Entotheonella gemina]|uniref:Uncharacterized protein n=1 Tax=Candidatus Entotheonella gemina TaxID=1429439 RepID=W4M185_9BACT|nr:MAG: hypothetical protein ETSY2_31625 [Candidatus Entotheonella gemina]